MMEIRKAREEELPRILEIYAYARETMRRTGNPNQWGSDKPRAPEVEHDLKNGVLMVAAEGNEIYGVFAMLTGEDPTYAVIDGGNWLNDEPYITFHKVASDGRRRGIVRAAVEYGSRFSENLRADTHEDNKIMQHTLESLGFRRCGIIYLADGDPRIAYHRCERRQK